MDERKLVCVMNFKVFEIIFKMAVPFYFSYFNYSGKIFTD